LGYVDSWSAAGAVEYSRLPEDGKAEIVQLAIRAAEEFNRRYVTPMRDEASKTIAARREHSEEDVDGGHRTVINELLTHWNPDWKPELLCLEVMAYLAGSVRTSMRAVCNSVAEINSWISTHPEDEPRLDDPRF